LYSRRSLGNTGVCVFFKEINRFNPNDCNAIASFYGVTGKKLQNQYKDFLSDFKIWNQNYTVIYLPENLGRTFID
jgi:predicted lactoylglutathione lyase